MYFPRSMSLCLQFSITEYTLWGLFLFALIMVICKGENIPSDSNAEKWTLTAYKPLLMNKL